MERGKLPEIPVPAWPQTATARLTNHPLSNREFLEVPIIFKYPDGKEAKLGQTLGLNSCKKLALQHVVDKSLIMSTGWSYTCCTIEEGSQCHRQLQ